MNKYLDHTSQLSNLNVEHENLSNVIKEVCLALEEKGYNPSAQLAGYILSGDPSYITNHKEARNKIRKYYREDLLEALISSVYKKS